MIFRRWIKIRLLPVTVCLDISIVLSDFLILLSSRNSYLLQADSDSGESNLFKHV